MAVGARQFTRSPRTLPRKHLRRWVVGYLFLLPAMVMYGIFGLYPFLRSIQLSLTNWDGVQPKYKFVGLENYARALQDSQVWQGLSHNVTWVIIGTVVPITIGLLLAVLLWDRPRGTPLFSTIYFMPQVLPLVVIAFIWGWIYHPTFGMLPRVLHAIGLHSLARGWLGAPNLALLAVLLAAIWAHIGFVTVVFMAGLQGVDLELLDAAKIDGANAWQAFWNVTIPQLSNTITMIVALSLIGGFSVFDIVWVMTQGGPANSTELIATYTFVKGLSENLVGYGAALSMIMTIIALVGAVAFIRLRERES
ncbi:MAG: sugar ABC transporter permease [Anaerolineae bacterium]|nr:sugar ABC transporter permease [Anaerolineae bacterium]